MGDGNCLFRAIAFVLYGSEMAREKIRELLVQFVSENRGSFRPYIDGELESYLAKMKYTRVWGTAVELLAVASLLQIPHVNSYKWFRYNPLCVDRLAFPSQDPPPKQLSRLNHITTLSLSMSDNVIMTAFYLRMEIIHWMSLLSAKTFTTTVPFYNLYTYLC